MSNTNEDKPLPAGEAPVPSPHTKGDTPPTPTNSSLLQKEPMEVHHHPHVGKKNFKEYLLEGLMIFVAVTLGFFAESLREHFTNTEIEHSNMKSLVRNLQDDTLSLTQAIQFNEMKSKWVDSFVALKGSRLPDTSFQKLFIYYAVKLSASDNFISNQTAFEQMKSSGTLRLIDPPNVIDSILKFQSMNEVIKMEWEAVSKWSEKNEEYFAESIDFTALLRNMNVLNMNMHVGDLRASELPAIKNDSALLQRSYNYEVEEKSSLDHYVDLLHRQLSYARTLIPFLKKQYDLHD